MVEPSSKPRRRKDQRPEEFVQAAMEVFCESGFANAKISDIARRAGAAKGTVYLYFKTKDELFEAVVREFIRPVFACTQEIVASFEGSTKELLTVVIERAYSEIVENERRRSIMRILVSEGQRFPNLTAFYHRAIIAGAEQTMRGILKRGIDRGEFRQALAADVPGVVVGPVVMAAIWKMIFESTAPLDLKKFAKAHIDLVLNGLLDRTQQ